MKIIAKLNYLRIAPRKVRMAADIIRGMDVKDAEIQLRFLIKRAAGPLLKLLHSAISNAQNNFNIEKDNLYISELQVNEGPPLKRWMPRAMGRAAQIMKRTSHINLVLETKKEVKVKKAKKIKPEVVKIEKGGEIKKEKPVESIAEKPQPEKSIPPQKPYAASGRAKDRFFSRQTFGKVKKMFRRKSF
jgi:large subunit ribosomal protein L22